MRGARSASHAAHMTHERGQTQRQRQRKGAHLRVLPKRCTVPIRSARQISSRRDIRGGLALDISQRAMSSLPGWSALPEDQRLAASVESSNPLIIFAPAGAGKTLTLVQRVHHLLAQPELSPKRVSPRQILDLVP